MTSPILRIRTPKPRRPRRRWLLAALISGGATLLAVELLSVLVYSLISDQPYDRSRIQTSLAERARSAPEPELGAEYDVVANFDGFNEVVLPLTDNVPNRVFPHYPRAWNSYADKGLSLANVAQVAELMSIRQQQHTLSRRFSKPPLRSSNFALILWEGLDRRYELEAQQACLVLVDRARRGSPDASHGPELDPRQTAEACARDSASRWAQASLQMRDVAVANGARYFHFLQPNQYVAGSKVFTDEEKRIADVDAYAGQPFPYHPSVRNYKRAAQLGYPLLIESGAALRRLGVDFVDLTSIFADVRESIYRDACCHYNETGYALVAEHMAREIGRADAAVD